MSAPAITSFLGIDFTALTFGEAVDAVFTLAAGSDFSYVVTPNVDHLVRLEGADNDDPVAAAFMAAYGAAALVLCDSRVLARLAMLSGKRLSLVPGSDLTPAVLADARMAGRRVAVIGGSDALLPALRRRYAAIDFVQHRPPMGVLHNPAAMNAIEAFVAEAGADLVIMAIGAPQGELAAHRCLMAGRSRGVALCAGASLEFIVGEKRRAPRWMQRLGAEWLFRLASEPRRLWRRYLVEGPRVFGIWWRRGRS